MKQPFLHDDDEAFVMIKPHWLVRKGNSLFAILFAIPFSLVFMIEYPDMINGNARLVATHPPKVIVANKDGRLMELLVGNNDSVIAGQSLARIESSVDYNEVQQLEKWMDSSLQTVGTEHLYDISLFPFPSLRQLGELQETYQEFENILLLTRQTIREGYYQQKERTLKRDLVTIQRIHKSNQIQKQLTEKDRALQLEELNAYEQLAKDKVIAPLELNQYKSKLLLKDQGAQQLEDMSATTELTALGKHNEILELQKVMTDQQQNFRSAFFELRSQIEEWKHEYVLIAPANGVVKLTSSLDIHQLLTHGQAVMYIQPFENNYYIELMVGQRGFGKIKKDQDVIIKLDGFPTDEFGVLKARVGTIANIPNRTDSFQIRAVLTDGSTTSYGKEVLFTHNLSASGQIIADQRKLIDRMLGEVRMILQR